jgi:hypothetical protein
MKRYIAFYGDRYYPLGGMKDFIGDFDYLDEAINLIETKHSEDGYLDIMWYQVYDTETKSIVYTSDTED